MVVGISKTVVLGKHLSVKYKVMSRIITLCYTPPLPLWKRTLSRPMQLWVIQVQHTELIKMVRLVAELLLLWQLGAGERRVC